MRYAIPSCWQDFVANLSKEDRRKLLDLIEHAYNQGAIDELKDMQKVAGLAKFPVFAKVENKCA